MAFARKNKSVVETNHVSAVRTGNIKAQHKAMVDMENGMGVLVQEDGVRQVVLANNTDNLGDVYLHVSEEQLYESHLGRNSFYIKAGQYPRCLKLTEGDVFETNALLVGAGITYEAGDTLALENGFWRKTASGDTCFAEIAAMVTLPNGETGAKIRITSQSTIG